MGQGMSPFKTKASSPMSSVSSQTGTGTGQITTPVHARSPSLPTAGPITKVRERTNRSSPMRPSISGGTPDSSVSEGDGSFRLHDRRKDSAPARAMTSAGGSRPVSRNADSRHGSMQSLESSDGVGGHKTSTGIRRTPSFQRSDLASRQRPGSSSTLPRKGSAPMAATAGLRTRNPSGSNTSSSISPSLSGGLGGSSALNKSRTPSSSNIPVLTTPTRGRTASGSSGSVPKLARERTSESLTGASRRGSTNTVRKPSGSTTRPAAK